MGQGMKRFEVYAYQELRPLLRDWFELWQGEQKRNNHRTLAEQTGLGDGTFDNIRLGRRAPAADTLRKLNRVMDLDEPRMDYLLRLAALGRARGTQAQRRALAAVLSHPGATEWVRSIPLDLRYLERWCNVALRELARLDPLPAAPADVRALLCVPVSEESVERSLDTLCELALLRRRPDGRYEAVPGVVESGPTVEGARALHTEMMTAASLALEAVPHRERFFGSLTLALPPEAWPEVANALWTTLKDLRDRYERTDQAERVIQVSIHAFPFSMHRPPAD
jgi:uncharacterized protein (TIGR02147 family)